MLSDRQVKQLRQNDLEDRAETYGNFGYQPGSPSFRVLKVAKHDQSPAGKAFFKIKLEESLKRGFITKEQYKKLTSSQSSPAKS